MCEVTTGFQYDRIQNGIMGKAEGTFGWEQDIEGLYGLVVSLFLM